MSDRLGILLSQVSAMGIPIEDSAEIPTIATGERGGKYIIVRNPSFWASLTPTDQANSLAHELGHILRGDCLVRKPNQQLYNVCCDAHINQAIHWDKDEFVRYDRLRQQYSVLPTTMPSTDHMYNLIEQALEQQAAQPAENIGLPKGCGMAPLPIEPKEHARTVLKARKCGAGEGIPTMPISSLPPAKPVKLPTITPLLQRINAVCHAHERLRTWRAPGRARGLKGIRRNPALRLLIGLDVSGSMQERLAVLNFCVEHLSAIHQCDTFVWADKAASWSQGAPLPDVGAGTQASAAIRYANRIAHDVVILLSDGDLAESTLPACHTPMIWLGGRPSVDVPTGSAWVDVRELYL